MDTISYIIILRALFVYSVIEKGWSIRKIKKRKNTFEMYKSLRK